MQDFIYYTPTKVFFGKQKENEVGRIVKNYNFKKVLIHYGQSSVIRSGLLDKVTNALKEESIEFVLLGDVEPNPKLTKVMEGKLLCEKEKVDFILAVGGGSVLDSAKSIAHAVANDCNPWKFHTRQEIPTKALPVATILTLAAAGSEMSSSSVITNDETLEKRGFNAETNRPLFAIMNPELTFSVSKYQTACGVVDILMHTLERYYSIDKEYNITDDVALAICKTVIREGKVAYNNPNNYKARADIMWASSLSHNDLTGVGRRVSMPVHIIEHEISGKFDKVAHGAGLAAIYCSWARYVCKENLDKFATFAYEVMAVQRNLTKEEAAIEGINRLERYFKDINMPISLNELEINVTDQIMSEFAEKLVTKMGTINDFVPIGYDQVIDILKLAKN